MSQNGSGSANKVMETFFANKSDLSLPLSPGCSGIQHSATLSPLPRIFKVFPH